MQVLTASCLLFAGVVVALGLLDETDVSASSVGSDFKTETI